MAVTINELISNQTIPQKLQEALQDIRIYQPSHKYNKKDNRLLIYGTIFMCSLIAFMSFIVYVFLRLFVQ
ncbi:MAG TPA: hypothetical protein PKY86_09250 [Niabella sp.]|nr:hypothetical protein [Niabella sp.]HQW14371.1 hypothetical protein [Niabella sp.]HQX18350.1 hypothetical protein [Niabella sp.]HQX40158.1 hypothetical protein [Niabella sp.]HRB05875.1 hypothetical protein [Niabella sp.]